VFQIQPPQAPQPPKPAPLWAKIVAVTTMTIIGLLIFGIILGVLTNLLVKVWT
jgi:hypothetical protein